MSDGSARKKIPGGKLVSVKIKYSDRVEDIQILGDFFLYPEESLSKIEDSVKGMSISSTQEQISQRISEAIAAGGIELIGATPEAIAQTILEAVRK